MGKRFLWLVPVLLMITLNIGFSKSVTRTDCGLTIIDYENRTIVLPKEATRIVSLVPSALRILVQVGAGDNIVAIDRKSKASQNSMLPMISKPSLKQLPIIGDRKEPNLEAILTVRPDLILTSTTADRANALQAALGIPVVCVVSEPDEDYSIIRFIGTIVGKQDYAEELVLYLTSMADDLQQKLQTLPAESRKRVYLALFTNSGKFTQTMPVYQSLKLAGGINVASGITATTSWGSVEVNKERILAWNPEIVFVDWRETQAYLSKDSFLQDSEFSFLRAVKDRKVYYSQTSHEGKDYSTALAEAYYMASVLYPELISSEYARMKAEDAYETMYGLRGYYTEWTKQYGIL